MARVAGKRGTLVYRRPIGWLSLKPFSVEAIFCRAPDEGRLARRLSQVRIKVADLPQKAQHQGPEQVRQFGIELLASERSDRRQGNRLRWTRSW